MVLTKAAEDDCKPLKAVVQKPGMSRGDLCTPSCMPAGLLQRAEGKFLDMAVSASVGAHLAPQASTAWRS